MIVKKIMLLGLILFLAEFTLPVTQAGDFNNGCCNCDCTEDVKIVLTLSKCPFVDRMEKAAKAAAGRDPNLQFQPGGGAPPAPANPAITGLGKTNGKAGGPQNKWAIGPANENKEHPGTCTGSTGPLSGKANSTGIDAAACEAHCQTSCKEQIAANAANVAAAQAQANACMAELIAFCK